MYIYIFNISCYLFDIFVAHFPIFLIHFLLFFCCISAMLKADIAKAVADAAQLGKEIQGLDADVSVWNGDMKAATSVRQIEKPIAQWGIANREYINTDRIY